MEMFTGAVKPPGKGQRDEQDVLRHKEGAAMGQGVALLLVRDALAEGTSDEPSRGVEATSGKMPLCFVTSRRGFSSAGAGALLAPLRVATMATPPPRREPPRRPPRARCPTVGGGGWIYSIESRRVHSFP